MSERFILASKSGIRSQLLRNAGIKFSAESARIDEEAIKLSMIHENAHPRDVADALAETKARKVAARNPDALVLGCDQVLSAQGRLFSKPANQQDAVSQLKKLRGSTHHLYSAAVLYEEAKPVWRHIGQVRLTMRNASDDYIEDYVHRNWESIRHSVGAYKLEEEGVRFFSRIDGDYFTVLGMPLLELLSHLTLRGTLPT
jgi:septum formation protein